MVRVMAFRISELGEGSSSLEFDEDDIPALTAAIEELFGPRTVEQNIIHDDVSFGGQEFIFYNEWGDPCLISRTEEGGKCLRCLLSKLSSAEETQNNNDR